MVTTFNLEGPALVQRPTFGRPAVAECAAIERESAEVVPSFDLITRFLPDSVVVAVRGEIDLLTAPALEALVAALMDLGHLDLVLDLAELDFMDAQGLRVLAAASARLHSTTGSLTIRSPSAAVRRVLDVAAMTDLVERRPVRAEVTTLGPEQPPRAVLGRPRLDRPMSIATPTEQPHAQRRRSEVLSESVRTLVRGFPSDRLPSKSSRRRRIRT